MDSLFRNLRGVFVVFWFVMKSRSKPRKQQGFLRLAAVWSWRSPEVRTKGQRWPVFVHRRQQLGGHTSTGHAYGLLLPERFGPLEAVLQSAEACGEAAPRAPRAQDVEERLQM